MNARDVFGKIAGMRQRLRPRSQLQRSLLGRRVLLRAWDPHLLTAVERLVHRCETLSEGHEPQLTICEVPRWRARRSAVRGCIVLPKFTSFELDTSSTSLSKDLARRWARCRASSFSVSVHRDAASFDFFHQRLYEPSLQARHGVDAYKRSRQYLQRGLSRGFLLFLSSGETVVAGALNVLRSGDHIADHWAGGVLDGDPTLVADGADLALVIRSRQWAARIGVRRMGLTQSQPFARDGLFAFKTGFSPEVFCPGRFDTALALKVREWSPGSRAVLDALCPVSFGVRPTLWHCGGHGLRLPRGLDSIDLERQLAGCSPTAAMERLAGLARRTQPNRRILRL